MLNRDHAEPHKVAELAELLKRSQQLRMRAARLILATSTPAQGAGGTSEVERREKPKAK
jgi:hypothetical protein